MERYDDEYEEDSDEYEENFDENQMNEEINKASEKEIEVIHPLDMDLEKSKKETLNELILKEHLIDATNVTKESLNNHILLICNVFDCESKEELIKKLDEINPNKQRNACTKALPSGSAAWSCEECRGDSNCIICIDCYERGKHLHEGHNLVFKSSVSGCCDCGDPDSWKPEGNCPLHQGIITDENLVKKLTLDLFSEEKLKAIKEILLLFFNYLNSCFHL